jgi:hypothetical protein
MSEKVFRYDIKQSRYSRSIRTVRCYLKSTTSNTIISEVEKTFYGFIPFQFFWIERWIKKTKKMLIRLEELKEKCKVVSDE